MTWQLWVGYDFRTILEVSVLSRHLHYLVLAYTVFFSSKIVVLDMVVFKPITSFPYYALDARLKTT